MHEKQRLNVSCDLELGQIATGSRWRSTAALFQDGIPTIRYIFCGVSQYY